MDSPNNVFNAAMADPSLTTSYALVAYLRMEADLADEKAKRLRAQAAALCARFGVTEEMQSQYELNPSQLPPVDENGVPKYRGKKRGRKPKPRKRKQDPNRRKRQHTAYTLFVQETYPGVKLQHPELQSKDVISLVAKQWKGFSAPEKKAWKDRAQATHIDEEEEEDTEVSEIAVVEDTATHHHLEPVHDISEATAAADAVYQQTVAEMEEAAEEEEEEEEEVGEEEMVEEEEEEEDEEHVEEEEEQEEEEVAVEQEPEDPQPATTRRRRGRPKKS